MTKFMEEQLGFAAAWIMSLPGQVHSFLTAVVEDVVVYLVLFQEKLLAQDDSQMDCSFADA